MDLDFGDLNYLAILAGVIINMVLGALWYSPFLLAKPWMAATGVTKEYIEEHKSEAYRGYAVSVAASIVIVFVLAFLVQNTGIDEAVDGLVLGLMAGVGLVATTQAANYAFEGRPLRLYLINIGYSVVGFGIIGVLLAVWE